MGKQTTTTPAVKVEHLTSAQAANRMVAEMTDKTTLSELAAKADALVVAGGGTANIRRTTHHVKQALETAEALGAVRLTKPTDLYVERVKGK